MEVLLLYSKGFDLALQLQDIPGLAAVAQPKAYVVFECLHLLGFLVHFLVEGEPHLLQLFLVFLPELLPQHYCGLSELCKVVSL